MFLIYPQRCYQFFHVVEKLEWQGNGSLLHKALGRASPLLQEVQLLVLEFLLLSSTDLGLSCPKGEIQKMTFGPATMDPTRPDLSEQLPFYVRSSGWAGSSVLQVDGPWGKLVAVSSSSHLYHTYIEGGREILQERFPSLACFLLPYSIKPLPNWKKFNLCREEESSYCQVHVAAIFPSLQACHISLCSGTYSSHSAG